MRTAGRLPDPALVVLIGAAGAGKSFWAAERYTPTEVVSSDRLRAMVGSGPADLEATTTAFELLDRIVSARLSRRLTTVIDTLGLDPARRQGYRRRAHEAGLPAVAVLFDTPPRLCRARNVGRDRPVPAAALARQLRAMRDVPAALVAEGWDAVLRITSPVEPAAPPLPSPPSPADPGLRVLLQVSRFSWQDAPGPWLRDLAQAANSVGLAGLALMDHLIQIPQVGRTWEPIPEAWLTLGFLAAADTELRLGTLVSPVTFRPAGILAKTVATLDALSGGRAFCGLGAGWWAREHAAYGLAFPPAAQRLDRLQECIETMRALWSPGTKAYEGRYVSLPETTSYPRPSHRVPILVGGAGERRTLRIVAEQADGCNLPANPDRLQAKLAVLRRHCEDVGRNPADLEITVLDVPVVGYDRADAANRVERLRGRTPAATFAAQHHAGTAADLVDRYRRLADLGVATVFCALPDLSGGRDLERLAPAVAALRAGQ